jgi:hypothetical protein
MQPQISSMHLPILLCRINGIIQYVTFGVCFFSLRMLLRFTQVVVSISNPFLFYGHLIFNLCWWQYKCFQWNSPHSLIYLSIRSINVFAECYLWLRYFATVWWLKDDQNKILPKLSVCKAIATAIPGMGRGLDIHYIIESSNSLVS